MVHLRIIAGIICLIALTGSVHAKPPNTLAELDPTARKLTEISLEWMDSWWKPETNMLGGSVRGTMIYATGLLLRDEPGDRERAYQAIGTVLDNQWNRPKRKFHGTYRRSLNEPDPPKPSRVWKDYDPNWREFIGTQQILILQAMPDRLSPEVTERIDEALKLAAEGALKRRVNPGYTNIALMSAYLLTYAGQRFDNPEWLDAGDWLLDGVYELFTRYETFEEYNSPTYYGVDLFGLGLWRAYPLTDKMDAMAQEMEAALWRDIGNFYHAGLKNMAGPYDRSYGMDMTKYMALVGMWIAMHVPEESWPLPDLTRSAPKMSELAFMPSYAMLKGPIPSEVQQQLLSFNGERRMERPISPEGERIAQAWLTEDFIVGAGTTPRGKPANNQAHPATVHWRAPNGEIAWLRLVCDWPASGIIDGDKLVITVDPGRKSDPIDAIYCVWHAPGVESEDLMAGRWDLPGLSFRVEAPLENGVAQSTTHGKQMRYAVPETLRGKPITIVLTPEPRLQ
jgi:hypothetical protein